jgi:hypothetical protein
VHSPGSPNIVAKVLADEDCRRRVEVHLEDAATEVRALLANHAYLVEALRDALLEREELLDSDIVAVLEAAEAGHAGTVADEGLAGDEVIVDLRDHVAARTE